MKKDNQTVFLAVHLPSQLINQLPAKVSTTVRTKESTQYPLKKIFLMLLLVFLIFMNV